MVRPTRRAHGIGHEAKRLSVRAAKTGFTLISVAWPRACPTNPTVHAQKQHGPSGVSTIFSCPLRPATLATKSWLPALPTMRQGGRSAFGQDRVNAELRTGAGRVWSSAFRRSSRPKTSHPGGGRGHGGSRAMSNAECRILNVEWGTGTRGAGGLSVSYRWEGGPTPPGSRRRAPGQGS